MKVEIQTKIESDTSPPKPAVYIQAGETMYSLASIDERIRAMQLARLWLKRELARK
jgi:hypothetical protein